MITNNLQLINAFFLQFDPTPLRSTRYFSDSIKSTTPAFLKIYIPIRSSETPSRK